MYGKNYLWAKKLLLIVILFNPFIDLMLIDKFSIWQLDLNQFLSIL
jgi:hypothetical protein